MAGSIDYINEDVQQGVLIINEDAQQGFLCIEGLIFGLFAKI